jgi:hypothetical protein
MMALLALSVVLVSEKKALNLDTTSIGTIPHIRTSQIFLWQHAP